MDKFTEQPYILVVDDDQDNVKILESFLGSEGYKTDRAYTGQEALQKLETKSFDLILLDVMLPDTDGYQICKKLKSSPNHKEIPITFVSALDRIDDKLKSLNVGAEDFLSKPIDEQELLLKVRRQIHNKILLDKTRREKRELKSLGNIISINYYEKSLEEILDIITIETSLLLGSDRTSIFLRNGKFLVSKNAQGLSSEGPLIIPSDKGIAGHVATSGNYYMTNDTEKDEFFNKKTDKKTGYQTRRVICCPIFHKHKVIGVIQSLNKQDAYTDYDLEMLKRIADHTSNILIRFYTEKRLKESEQLYKNLMDGMNNALFTVDNDGKISYVNNSFTKLTGYIPDEIIRKDIKILFIPTDLHNINDLGDDIEKIQTQIISKDFDLFPVEISVRPFSIENKTGRIFTAIDMRDRIEIEKRQLEMQKMRSDFNSMIVHDLKNPLSIIMGFAEMLESQTIGELNQKQSDFVAKIVDSSEQLLKLTNEILEISKFESGKMPLKMQELDISDLINQIVQTQQLSFKKKDISFIED
ncbi:MAG: response regulator, partial [Calditrichaeota bacterium]|nr:response regulator [Calditrichota bacterium]